MSFTLTPDALVSRRATILGAAGGLGLAAAATTSADALSLDLRRERRRQRRRQARRRARRKNAAAALVAVRVFPSYKTKVYRDHDAVLAHLKDLGIKRISHKMTPAIASDPDVIAFTQRAYFELGIKTWFTVGEPLVPLTPAAWDKMVAAITGPLAGMVERVYGWNEPNHVRGGGPLPQDWDVMTAAHQQQLWARLSPLGIKVGTPQLWSGDLNQHDRDLAMLAPRIAGSFDHIGWHLYPRGGVGVELLDRFDETYRRILGDFPVVCTEAGHFTAPNYVGGAINVSEEEQAVCAPMLIDEYLKRGYGISYFELLDDPDPTGANREAHLGLFRTPSIDATSWTPKPAYESIKARLARLQSA